MSEDEDDKLDGEYAGLVYVPAPCPQCGALNENEANEKCTQTQDQTGEYSCAGEFKNGVSMQPTPESIAEMNRWIDEQVAKDDADDEFDGEEEHDCGEDTCVCP